MKAMNTKNVLCICIAASLAACGGSGGGNNDNSVGGGASRSIRITEQFNVAASAEIKEEQLYRSLSNGVGIGQIQLGDSSSAQPDNGYRISTVDIVNSATAATEKTLDFAADDLDENATAAELAAFFNQQSTRVDTRASTMITLSLSAVPINFDDALAINGTTITGDTVDEIMSAIDRLPDITASVDSSGLITVTATDGNDLRVDLSGADINDTGKTATLTSLQQNDGATVEIDSATIGDGQTNSRATVGGVIHLTLDYPFQLANAGSGNVFGTTLTNTYESNYQFDATDPDTYNHAYSIGITDSLGADHIVTEYFVKANNIGGAYPNRWNLYILIDGMNVGAPGTDGEPITAAFDIFFDSNGQLDTALTDAIEISAWVPRNDDGTPNGAETTRITFDISNSTQFGGTFSMQNVSVD